MAMPRGALRVLATGKASVLDSFGDVGGANRLAVGQIGDSARYFKNAMPSSRRKIKTTHGLLEQLGTGLVGRATGLDFRWAEAGVRFLLARGLDRDGLFDAGTNGG